MIQTGWLPQQVNFVMQIRVINEYQNVFSQLFASCCSICAKNSSSTNLVGAYFKAVFPLIGDGLKNRPLSNKHWTVLSFYMPLPLIIIRCQNAAFIRNLTHPSITCSELTIEKLEQGMKYVQN